MILHFKLFRDFFKESDVFLNDFKIKLMVLAFTIVLQKVSPIRVDRQLKNGLTLLF